MPISDARVVATGNSFLATEAGVFPAANPASLFGAEETVINTTYKKFSRLPGMDQISASVISKFHNYTTGLSVFRAGDEHFSQYDVSAGVAHRIAHTALGLRMDLLQLRASGFNTVHAFSLSAGFISRIGKKATIGASVQQLNNPAFGAPENKFHPIFSMGFSFQPAENLLLNIAIRKDVLHSPQPCAGLEYQLKPLVFIRTGLQLNPYAWSAGIGFRYWKVVADYALVYSRFSGINFQATARIFPGQLIKSRSGEK